jgi:hypothetical protein
VLDEAEQRLLARLEASVPKREASEQRERRGAYGVETPGSAHLLDHLRANRRQRFGCRRVDRELL